MGRAGNSLDDELPPRSGGGSPLREELLVGRKRGGPWSKLLLLFLLLLNVIITYRIIIVERDGPRRVTLAAGISHILQKVSVNAKQNDDPPRGTFVVVTPF